MNASDRAIANSDIAKYQKQFDANPHYKILQNAATMAPVSQLAIRRDIAVQANQAFSTHLDSWIATNQKKSGRCWAFAGLNLLRIGSIKKLKVKSFELSQNYLMFWDKFEKSNWFLEAMIETADRHYDDRTVHYLLAKPSHDGGQWNMFADLVKKYGLVPQNIMPETESSSNSGLMNQALKEELVQAAIQIRHMKKDGESDAGCRQYKQNILTTIYRILCIHLGTPPTTFDWQWMDKDRKFNRDGEHTTHSFAEQYLSLDLSDYYCLVNDPRNEYGKTYTVDYLGCVKEGAKVTYLNVDIELMKSITQQTLEEGEAVWMGCDVSKQLSQKFALWDKDLFDYGSVYDSPRNMTKADRLRHRQSQMTHAMLFTGVDVLNGKPRCWRVENSWGVKSGHKGFYQMNDNWFDEYMLEIAAHKKYIPAELLKAFDEEPTLLPAWDPMGALAEG